MAASALIVLSLSTPGCGGSSPSRAVQGVLILAAASTINALDDAIAEFTDDTGIQVRASYGPTSTLARQVTSGAPADLLLSASTTWANYVEEHQTVVARSSIAGNRLVVVVPRETTIGTTVDLTSLVSDARFSRVAIADTEAVPAGVYAREALETLGLWSRIEPRLLPTLDVRAALALAAGREADAAFVYSSDAATSDAVRVITSIDESTHSPIEYPLLLLDAESSQAAELYDFLVSERGRNHFIERGFAAPREVSF